MLHATRFRDDEGALLYGKVGMEWSFFYAGNSGMRPSRVGALYATKAELLSDLNRYAKDYGMQVA